MRIVVVEDESLIRNGLGKMLGKINPSYELVGKAENGEKGLAVIRRERPDLVITDIQMPELDGLAMLSKLREEGIPCKAVVLTAYSDFQYAKLAIELGIENYLLKPIKIPELKRTLESVEESLQKERSQDSFMTLEHIFRSSILGDEAFDSQINRLTVERYELDIEEPLAVLSLWLGENYLSRGSDVERLLQGSGAHMSEMKFCLIPSERYNLVLMIMYGIADMEQLRRDFETAVVPSVYGSLGIPMIGTWGVSRGMAGLAETFDLVLQEREWNLCCKPGTLITPEWVEQAEIMPVKYPSELEKQACQALSGHSREEFMRCFSGLEQVCRDVVHSPQEIRETFVRCCMAVTNLAKQTGILKEDASPQPLLQRIMEALTWEELEAVFSELYRQSEPGDQEDGLSPLVKRAGQLIEEFYSQGITLEEIAERLKVSEEYLSTQFKKETGASFSETIRRYRIQKVKELLIQSNLKLNQIADLAGYSDPKYMSKVFKEEVGVLPAEYRKNNR